MNKVCTQSPLIFQRPTNSTVNNTYANNIEVLLGNREDCTLSKEYVALVSLNMLKLEVNACFVPPEYGTMSLATTPMDTPSL